MFMTKQKISNSFKLRKQPILRVTFDDSLRGGFEEIGDKSFGHMIVKCFKFHTYYMGAALKIHI